ncbi:MAG: bacillithiol biosynthesis BshC, partial [Chitinophagales bacterium]
ALIKEFVMHNSGEEISLHPQRMEADRLFRVVMEKAKAVDTTLEKSVFAEHQNFLNALDRLEAKIIKARKHRLEVELNQIKAVRQRFFPANIPQERDDNFMQWYVAYGDTFIEMLVRQLDPFGSSLTIFQDS